MNEVLRPGWRDRPGHEQSEYSRTTCVQHSNTFYEAFEMASCSPFIVMEPSPQKLADICLAD